MALIHRGKTNFLERSRQIGTLNSQRSDIQVPEVLTTKHSYVYTPLMEHNRTRRERILAKGSTKMDRKDMELASTYMVIVHSRFCLLNKLAKNE